MSNPFDFNNTPITDNTLLVARYQSNSPTDSYGGSWFRLTDTNGNKYVPINKEAAFAVASLYWKNNTLGGMVNESTGEEANINASQITQIEFSDGWEDYTSNYLFFGGSDDASYKEGWSKIAKCSGSYNIVPTLNYGYDFYPSNVLPQGALNTHSIDITGMKITPKQAIAAAVEYCGFAFDAVDSGYYGVIEITGPYDNALWTELGVSSDYKGRALTYGFGTRAGHNSVALGSVSKVLLSKSFVRGIGFVGDYAESWYNAFPPDLTGHNIYGSAEQCYYCRKTYIG